MQVPKNEKDTNVTSNEELVRQIYVQEQVERAFQQLILNLRPMMIKIGKKHLSKIPIYDLDDYVQEGSIILWQLMKSKKYNWKDKFSTLFYAAFERRCINLYRDYVLKNMIVLSEAEDIYGYGYHLTRLVEDEYAKRYREKHREECRRWYEKHRKKPNAESRPKLTEEEKKERSRQKAREYYIAHREQCIEAKRKWVCSTFFTEGKKACPSKQIPDSILMDIAAEYGGADEVERIIANPGNELIFILRDGNEYKHIWKDRSRSQSWTPEMREKAREQSKCRKTSQ